MSIHGYTHGSAALAASPVSLSMFEEMKKSALFGEDDIRHLRLSHDVVAPQVESILDVWYGFIGSTPHLVASFADRHGTPSAVWVRCASALGAGSWTRRAPSTIRPG